MEAQETLNRSYYAVLPANVRYDKRITANAKLLFTEITALTNDKGYCWASNKYFAELYEVDPRTIQRYISALEKCGYITVRFTQDVKTNMSKRVIALGNQPNSKIDVSPTTKMSPPPRQNCHTPHDKNVTLILKENNISIKENIYTKEILQCLEYLNQRANTHYSSKRVQNIEKLLELFNDGFTLDDVKKVIDKKVNEWKGTDFAKYLRPDTLFGDKFESYLYAQPCKFTSPSHRREDILEHEYSEAQLKSVLTSIEDIDTI